MFIQTRTLLFSTLLTLTGVAAADEYFPPVGTGWWQLQTIDTFEQVCATEAGPCNPPAGTYRLIDFGTTPATRSLVEISEMTPSASGRVFAGARSVQTVNIRLDSSNNESGVAFIDCGDSATAIGGMCSAVLDNAPVPLFDQGVTEQGLYFCAAADGATVTLQPTCAVN